MQSFWINRASRRLVILLAGSVLLGSIGQAAHAASLTLSQAIDIAIQNNKDLQAARHTVEGARARLLQAGLRPNPRLDIATNNDFIFGNKGQYTTSVGLSQQFSVTNRITRQKDVARADVALAQTEIAQAELKLAGDMASQFYHVLALNRQIEVRERLIDVEQKLVLGTRNRFKAAEVSVIETSGLQSHT